MSGTYHDPSGQRSAKLAVDGVWLSEHIPGARAHIIEGEGHASLILRIEQILDDLLERAGLPGRPGSAPLTG